MFAEKEVGGIFKSGTKTFLKKNVHTLALTIICVPYHYMAYYRSQKSADFFVCFLVQFGFGMYGCENGSAFLYLCGNR